MFAVSLYCLQNGKFLMTSATGRTTPYWIVKLYGDASAGYEAALVYSCAVDASTGMMPQVHKRCSTIRTELYCERGANSTAL